MRVSLPLGRLLFFVCMFLIAVIVLIPMRLGLDWLGLDERGVAAREARGSVWNGLLTEAQFGGSDVGDVDAGLGLFPLLIGRARLSVARDAPEGEALG
ncbi:MAG: type II secretion system protein GspN [Sphingomonadaceae bacterium]|nr:type II secretion system protein GspN [Sphingomonadaceae bacterium]